MNCILDSVIAYFILLLALKSSKLSLLSLLLGCKDDKKKWCFIMYKQCEM